MKHNESTQGIMNGSSFPFQEPHQLISPKDLKNSVNHLSQILHRIKNRHSDQRPQIEKAYVEFH
jgi:hypothetical protein